MKALPSMAMLVAVMRMIMVRVIMITMRMRSLGLFKMLMMMIRAVGMVMVAIGPMHMVMIMLMAIMRMMVILMISMAMTIIVVMLVISMAMAMFVMIMPMVVMAGMVMASMVMAGMVIGPALRRERPPDFLGQPALSAHHLGQHMISTDIDRIGTDLGRRMAVADMPGDTGHAEGIFSRDLEQFLWSGAHANQTPIFQLQSIAIANHRGLVEIEQQIEALLALQRDAALLALIVIERDGIDDLVGLDGDFADNARGTQHGAAPVM
jgi:hypothetical protein